MNISFDYYKTFYHVAKYKNITTASKLLFLSQSTVSRAIQNLESELGTQLFVRSKKGVTLTEAGQILYTHIEQAFAHISAGENQVESMLNLESGTLRIGSTEMIMKYYLMPILEDFHRQYPHIHLDISFGYPRKVASELRSHLLDVAVITSPLDIPSECNVFPFIEFHDYMLASSAYSELKGKTMSLSELEKYPFVGMRNGMSARSYLENIFIEKGILIQPSYEAESMPMVIELIKAGFGIGCAPEIYVNECEAEGSAFRVHLEEELPVRTINVITDKQVSPTLQTLKFLEVLGAHSTIFE